MGLQNANQCFCGGNTYDKHGPAENCDKACRGDDREKCGGTWANQVYEIGKKHCVLTLKVLVATIDAQWEGMGDVGSARYEPALLPPCPTIRVLS